MIYKRFREASREDINEVLTPVKRVLRDCGWKIEGVDHVDAKTGNVSRTGDCYRINTNVAPVFYYPYNGIIYVDVNYDDFEFENVSDFEKFMKDLFDEAWESFRY